MSECDWSSRDKIRWSHCFDDDVPSNASRHGERSTTAVLGFLLSPPPPSPPSSFLSLLYPHAPLVSCVAITSAGPYSPLLQRLTLTGQSLVTLTPDFW